MLITTFDADLARIKTECSIYQRFKRDRKKILRKINHRAHKGEAACEITFTSEDVYYYKDYIVPELRKRSFDVKIVERKNFAIPYLLRIEW